MNHERTRMSRIGFPVLAAILLAGGAQGATAKTFFVNGANGGNAAPPYTNWTTASTTIQAAVNQAEAAFGPGTNCTVVVTNGTYLLSATVMIGKAITVRGFAGRGAVINGGGVTRCVTINATGAVFDGFTVSNGYITTTTPTLQGAGIHVTGGTIRNCTITHNVAHQASATAAYYGVGVYAKTATLTNCLIAFNRCTVGSSSASGGGVCANGTLLLDCLITSNVMRSAAGIYLGDSTAIARRCEISYNEQLGSGGGGGVVMQYGTLENCLVIGNEAAGAGGGVLTSRSSDTIRNCTIVGNRSSGNMAGGVSFTGGSYTPSMVNSIVWGNQGIYGLTGDVQGYTNKITYSCATELTPGLNGNRAALPRFSDWDAGHGYGLAHVRGSYRLALASPCRDTGTATGAPNHDYDVNPRPADGNQDGVAAHDLGCYEAPDAALGPLAADFSVLPAEGAAPLEVAFAAALSGDDAGARYQWVFGDGTTKSWSSDAVATHVFTAACTSAYEVVLSVTNAAGAAAAATNAVMVYPAIAHVWKGGGHEAPFDTWAKAATNIQAAIDVAGERHTTVLVTNDVYYLNAQIEIGKAITVASVNGPAVSILDAQGPSRTNRCVLMTAIYGATLDGFTLRKGIATSSGGGVSCAFGTVQNCAITGNVALGSGSGGGGGGGVYLHRAGKLRDSTVAFNGLGNGSASPDPFGGGVRSDGIAGFRCMISNSVIANNANSYTGGGLYGSYTDVLDSRITGNRVTRQNSTCYGGGAYVHEEALMDRCIIASNTCGLGGGGVDVRGTAVLRNCLVVGNQSRSSGGGLLVGSNTGSRQRVENCTIVGNALTLAGQTGGGLYCNSAGSRMTNNIVHLNQAAGVDNNVAGTYLNFFYSCSPDLQNGVNGNKTADPQFANPGSGYGLNHVPGDYHLRKGSPCANTGAYSSWMNGAVDLEGALRIRDGAVNIGAYERLILPAGTLINVR